MNRDQIVQQVMNELMARQKSTPAVLPEAAVDSKPPAAPSETIHCGLSEFVGVGPYGDSLGLVIANLDSSLHQILGIPGRFRSIGVLTARCGAGPEIMAADEAVKSCNAEVVLFEQSNDTKGGGGHGSILMFGAEDVSDARRAVEVALQALEWSYGGIVSNGTAYVECQYTARASYALEKYMHAQLGKAWGLVNGCPAGIGVLMADAALKAANVELVAYGTSNSGSNEADTNEFITMFIGDSAAVLQAVRAGRDVGLQLVRMLGTEPTPTGTEYF